jgi:predicted secreted protein
MPTHQEQHSETLRPTPLSVPIHKWASISMDFNTFLPKTARGNAGLFVFFDRLSKLIRIAATPANTDTPEVARLFHTHVYRHRGLPPDVISDRDLIFMSKFWTTLFGMLPVQLRPSSANHAATDGQTEVFNRKLKKFFVISSTIINPIGMISSFTWSLSTVQLHIASPTFLHFASRMELNPEMHPSV